MAEFASRGVGNAGLTTGIIGTALGAANSGILGNLFGNMNNGYCGNMYNNGYCEHGAVNRYELGLQQRIANLESGIALRDANIYNDAKSLELYKYFDGKIEAINARIGEQAVFNATTTATINCMAGQIAQLMSLTKLVVPNSSVCPGWGGVTVTPTTTPATTTGAII